ncbi:unnamed protein product [Hermetia illucens]|uniref:Uncharacterized protein n=1 Tax=Hermetia illucens TaxID=343691 RepID=A0A7R8UJH5_HERIL|nr:unnamed protein product [Hermetia illucens]
MIREGSYIGDIHYASDFVEGAIESKQQRILALKKREFELGKWNSYMNEVIVILAQKTLNKGSETAKQIQLHGFCDASQRAYGAITYLKTLCTDHVDIHPITAKSRVALIEPISIPRIKLKEGLILAEMMSKVEKALGIGEIEKFG